jgi:uncharacterized protein (TIGR00369 family)
MIDTKPNTNSCASDDQALFAMITEIFNAKIPFNKVLGLAVAAISYERVEIVFDMRDELIGNYMRGTLHGGVISSVIDVTGGLAAFMGLQRRMVDKNLEAKLARFGRLGTIDLRVDYLRPGLGRSFVCSGYTLRTGSKVAVTRIELNNDRQDLIAVGTGSYIVA